MPTCKLLPTDPRNAEELLEQLREIEREWCGLGWWCRQMARYVKKYREANVIDFGAESVNAKPHNDRVIFHDALAQLRPHLPKNKKTKIKATSPKHETSTNRQDKAPVLDWVND